MKTNLSPWKSVKTRLTLFTLGIFLASLWALTFIADTLLHRDLEKMVSQQQLTAAQFMASEINQQIEERFSSMRLVASEITPALMGSVDDAQQYMDDRPIFQVMFNGGTFIVGLDGKATASIPLSAKRRGVEYLDRDFIQAALREGKSTVGKPVIGKMLNAPIFVMAVPITNKQGVVIGALAGITNLGTTNFLDKITQNRYGTAGGYLLVSKAHRLIVSGTDKRFVMRPLRPAGEVAAIDQFVQGYEGSATFVNALGVHVLSSAKGIPAANWYVAVNLPTSEAFAPVVDLQRSLFLSALALTLVAGLLTWWMLGRQLSPLVEAANTIRLTEQFHQPLPIAKDDEIGDLLGGFNGLLEKLGEREVLLQATSARLTTLLEWAPVAIVVHRNGKLLYINPAAVALFGATSAKELLGTPILDYVHPDYQQVVLERVRNAMQKGIAPDKQVDIFCKIDGTPMQVEVQGCMIEFDGLPALQVAIRDVTAELASSAQLASALRESQALMDAINHKALVSIANLAGDIIYANEKFIELSGYSHDEIVGSNHRIVKSGAQADGFWDSIWKTISAGYAWSGVICNRAKDGTPYWVDTKISPFFDAQGQVERYVSIRLDITELVLANKAAQLAATSKSQFLANMSHEIRTPMNAILGMLQLLQNTEMTGRQQDYTNKTQGAAKSLLGLLNDILDFSKIDAGKMELDNQPFQLERVLSDLSVIVSANVGPKDVEVLYDIDPAVPRALMGDSLRLQQVLINLSGNAIKFTAQGEVVIQIKVLEQTPEQATLRFAVRDTGIGIAPEHQQRIFSGFSQAEASTTRKFGGTGLGLSISKRLVTLMGSELILDSVLGSGSTFHFTLTLPVVAQESSTTLASATSTGALQVLVVDDNPVARGLLADMARACGWSVETSPSGTHALALYKARNLAGAPPFQVLLMDWEMPELDGWDTIACLRELDPTAKPPITVMVTAHGRDKLSQRTSRDQTSLHAFLVKPVTAYMLSDAVSKAQLGHSSVRVRPRATHVSGDRLRGLRLLLVEDNPINQQVALELLEGEGATVALADNGQLGVDAVRDANPTYDAVLMDVQMPVMDGYTATHVIREDLGLVSLPIIAMTANAMASDREACLAAGMTDHIGKPFDLPYLIQVLRKHTGLDQIELGLSIMVSPTKEPLPSTEALDVAGAVARMGGNLALYLRSVQPYIADLTRLPDQLDACLQAGKLIDATRLLHTLKGLSATVGAKAIAMVAATGEKLIQTGGAPEDWSTFGTAFRTAVNEASTALTDMVHQLSERTQDVQASSTPVKADALAMLTDLQALSERLRVLDMDAMVLYAELRQKYPTANEAGFDALDYAMSDMDFDTALTEADTLLQSLRG